VVAGDDVSVTEPPEQNVVAPPGVIVGVDGALGPVSVCAKLLDEQPDASTREIVYEPEPRFGIVAGRVTPAWLPEEVPVHIKFPVAEPVTWMLPSVDEQVVGFETVPKAIVVLGLITTEVELADELHPLASVVTE